MKRLRVVLLNLPAIGCHHTNYLIEDHRAFVSKSLSFIPPFGRSDTT